MSGESSWCWCVCSLQHEQYVHPSDHLVLQFINNAWKTALTNISRVLLVLKMKRGQTNFWFNQSQRIKIKVLKSLRNGHIKESWSILERLPSVLYCQVNFTANLIKKIIKKSREFVIRNCNNFDKQKCCVQIFQTNLEKFFSQS